ncbi:carboxypeptidase regulatory-like domain-containing protein [Wenzhouxiangella sp. EGI_FJ10305]|uniref:carboxypeptidase regulatory-like domain-containing protein n=1 Tax=Wenzhouxiangella sp. EGI_FJ10305 TaxID=3243768 RepID=UPI0035D746E6
MLPTFAARASTLSFISLVFLALLYSGPAAGTTISGIVTDADSGAPIADIDVCSIRAADPGQQNCVTSDATGEYAITGLPESGEVYVSTVETTSYPRQAWPGISTGEPGLEESIDLAAGDRTDIDFSLVPGFRITGTATGPGGSTLDSFGVQFTRSTAQGRTFVGGVAQPDGSFESGTMIPGDYKVLVTTQGTVADPDHHIDQLFDGVSCVDRLCDLDSQGTPVSLVDADIDIGTVELQTGYVITGTLTESATTDSVPDGSVFIQIFDLGGSLVASTGVSGGDYATGALPDGDYRVLFNAEAAGGPYLNQIYNSIDCGSTCNPASQGDTVAIAGADVTIDAALSEGGVVSGSVTSSGAGLPIEGEVRLLSTAGDILRTQSTSGDGSYSIEGLDPNDYLVYFQSGGESASYLDQLHDGVTCPSMGCDVSALGTPVTVSAAQETIVNAQLQQGALLAGTVSRAGGGSATDVSVQLFDTIGNLVAEAPVNENGEYSIAALPGTYKLQASPYGSDGDLIRQMHNGIDCVAFCDLQIADTIDLSAGEQTVDFTLNPGYRLFGQVVDDGDSGTPIAEGSVDLYDADGVSLGGFGLAGDGSWSSPAMPAGSYKLWFNPSGNFSRYQQELYNDKPCSGFCDVQNDGDIIDLVDQDIEINAGLTRQNAITGQITEQATGDPITSDVLIEAYDPTGQSVASTLVNQNDGSYLLGLPDGEYRIKFNPVASRDMFVDELFDDIPCPYSSCDITNGSPVLLDGADAQADADLSLGGTISGSVVANTDGMPVVDSGSVQLISKDGSISVGLGLSATGSFEFVGLPAGEYWLLARSNQTDPPLVDQLFDGVPCPDFNCDYETDGGTPVVVTSGATAVADFVLEPVPTYTVSGVVTDSTTGEPIPDITVEAFIGGSVNNTLTTVTDADGQYQFDGLLENEYAFVYEGSGYMTRMVSGFSPTASPWCPARRCFAFPGTKITVDADVSDLSVEMDPGGRISGTLRLPDGTPASAATNARIRPYDADGNQFQPGFAYAIDFYNDTGDGSFATELPPGQWFLLFETNNPSQALVDTALGQHPCPRGSCGMTTTQAVDVAQGAEITGLEVQFSQGVAITGTMLDADTGPAVPPEYGAVMFYAQDNSYAGFASVSNTDGSFSSASGFPDGDWYAATIDDSNDNPFSQVPPEFIDVVYDNLPCQNGCDFSAGTPIVIEGDPPAPIEINLTRGASVAGNIQGPSGALEGVEVRLFDGPDNKVGSAFSDADGNYTVAGLLPGTYYAVTGSSLGLEDRLYNGLECEPFCNPTSGTPIEVTAAAEITGIDFSLQGAASLAGVVSDEFDGPLEAVEVEVYDALGQLKATALTNAAGEWQIGNLAGGRYFMRTRNSLGLVDRGYDGFDCPACGPAHATPIELEQGEERVGINVQLVTGATISGVVLSAAGSDPIGGVNVDVFDASGEPAGTDITTSGGNWEVNGLAPGDYFVATRSSVGFVDELFSGTACEPDCLPTDGTPISLAAGAADTADFSLQPAGRIGGTVRDDAANALGGVIVRAVDATGRIIRSATSGIDGSYEIGGLPAGNIYLRTNAPGSFTDQVYAGFDCVPVCDALNGTAVTVSAGGLAGGVDFSLTPGGGIAGQLTDQSDNPLSAVQVEVYNRLGTTVATVNTNAAGDYIARGLSDGRHFVRTRNGRGLVDEVYRDLGCTPTPCIMGTGTAIDLTGGIVEGIDFSLAGGSTISGTATDQFGNPLPSGEVVLYGELGREVKRAPISSGTWSLTGIADGSYFLVVLNGSRLIDELFADIPCPGGQCDITQGTPLVVGDAGAAPEALDAVRDSSKAARSTGEGPIEFSLQPGSLIRGHVENGQGKGIANATITFFNAAGEVVGQASTNGAGDYESSAALSAGTYFAATSDGLERGIGNGLVNQLYSGGACALECDVTAGTEIVLDGQLDAEGIDFSAQAGGSLSGLAVDGSDNGLVGTEIQVFNGQGQLAGKSAVDSLGNWTVDGLPDGNYYVLLKTDLLEQYDDFVVGLGACVTCDPTSGTQFTISGASSEQAGSLVLNRGDIIFQSDFSTTD